MRRHVEEHLPKLSMVFHLSPDDVWAMPPSLFNRYVEALNALGGND